MDSPTAPSLNRMAAGGYAPTVVQVPAQVTAPEPAAVTVTSQP